MLRRFDPRRGLFLGYDMSTHAPLSLLSEWLATGVHILGRTGSGKTRLLRAFIEQLIGYRDATVIIINPKGDLGRATRDATIAAGQARRLVVFDPADTTPICGYNPLRPNGLAPHVQAKAARDALLAGLGQTALTHTPQLARHLYLVLAAARLCELTLTDASELLLPDSEIRSLVLRTLDDPHLVRALTYFDNLRASRQDELAASTLARLDAFTLDPILRRITTQQTHSLDLGAVIREHRVLIANLELYKPLRPNEVSMLGRLLINDVLAHVFGRTERSPVFLIVDEVELFATPDLCTATNLGREMGLCIFAAHQDLEQLTLEDNDRKLRAAMLNNAVTKIVCGSPGYEDLATLGPELFVDEFDPTRVKHDHLELDPVEERRVSVGVTANWGSQISYGVTESDGTSESENEGTTDTIGSSSGISKALGEAATESEGESEASTESESETDAETIGTSEMTAHTAGSSEGHTDSDSQSLSVIPREDGSYDIVTATGSGSGTTHGVFSSETTAHGDSHSITKSRTTGQATTRGKNTGRAVTYSKTRTASGATNESHAITSGTTRDRTIATATSNGTAQQHGGAITKQTAPWMSYRKSRVPTAFWSFDESLLAFIQKVRRNPVGCFVVKVPTKPAVFVRAPYVKSPVLGARRLASALEQMRALPCYSHADQIAEEAARRRQLTGPVEPPTNAAKKKLPRVSKEWDFGVPKKLR
jgi:hypothetical protein